jgi:hypothetical protein
VSLILVLACLVPEVSAEELFKKIESSIEKAKTIRVKFKLEVGRSKEGPSGQDAAPSVQGLLLAKGEDRLRFRAVIRNGVVDIDAEMGCLFDGAQMYTWSGKGWERSERPRPQRAEVNVMLARMGAFRWVASGSKQADGKGDPDYLKVRDLKVHPGNDRETLLSYSVRLEEVTTVADVKLWIDRRSLKPVRREFTIKKKGEITGNSVESYEEYDLRGDISDGEFDAKK